MNAPKGFITTVELARVTGLEPRTIQRRANIPGRTHTAGGCYLFKLSADLNHWISHNTLLPKFIKRRGRKGLLFFKQPGRVLQHAAEAKAQVFRPNGDEPSRFKPKGADAATMANLRMKVSHRDMMADLEMRSKALQEDIASALRDRIISKDDALLVLQPFNDKLNGWLGQQHPAPL